MATDESQKLSRHYYPNLW